VKRSGERPAAREICGRDEIVAIEAAVPLAGVAVSQSPPSPVLWVTVQFNVPVPPFPICTICEVAVPFVLKEKLKPPGRLSKNGPPARTVRFTGTTIDRPGLANSVKIISRCRFPPPACWRVTLAVMASGVKQQPLPLGEIFSQLPP